MIKLFKMSVLSVFAIALFSAVSVTEVEAKPCRECTNIECSQRDTDCSGRHIECGGRDPLSKLKCEAEKSAWKAQCEANKSAAKASCEAEKSLCYKTCL